MTVASASATDPLLPRAPGGSGTGRTFRPVSPVHTPKVTPAEAWRRAREHDGVAVKALAVGIGGLPILRPTVGGNLGPADAAMMLCGACILVWAGSTRQVLRGAYLLPSVLTMLAGMVAGLAGAAPAAALLAVAQDFYLLLWALACLNVARTADAAASVARSWCYAAFGWSVTLFLVVGRTALTATTGDTRLAFTSDTNGAGLYFVLSIFVMIAARRPRRRLWRWTAITFLLADTVLTGSLGALSGLLAGLATAIMMGVAARRGPAPALALALALGLTAGSATLYVQRYRVIEAAHASGNAVLRNSLGRGLQTSTERQALTRETLGLVTSAGPAGYGPNTTEQLLRTDQAPYPKQAHNDWIAALVERGVLGFAGMALLAFEVVRRTAQVRDATLLTPAHAEAFPAVQYLAGGAVTVAIFSLTHEVLHDRTAWTLLGLIAALAVFGRPARQPGGGTPCVHS